MLLLFIAACFIKDHAQHRHGSGLGSQDVRTEAHEVEAFFFRRVGLGLREPAFGPDENDDVLSAWRLTQDVLDRLRPLFPGKKKQGLGARSQGF